jgi:hypothetical protein
MVNPQRVIDESRPMLEKFLRDIGLHCQGPLDFGRLLEPFSRWVDAQEVTEADRFYLASRLAAFICEYLIATRSGTRVIDGGRILMRVPIEQGVLREFDPYAVALGMATTRSSLKTLLDALNS